MLNEVAERQRRRLVLADLEDITGCSASRLESQTFMEQGRYIPGSALLLLPFFFLINIISCLLKSKKFWPNAVFQRLQGKEKADMVKITHFCFHKVLPRLFIFLE